MAETVVTPNDTLRILRGDSIYISDFLSVRQPTLGEIADYGDIAYYSMVSSLCATPTDYMVFLEDNLGIAYETCPEIVLFAIILKSLSVEDTRILFGNIDLSLFTLNCSEDGKMTLRNPNGYVINEPMYQYLMSVLRKAHGLKKNVKIPGNAAAKRYNLMQARRAIDRNKRRKKKNEEILAPVIISMVNSEQFKYNFENVFNLTLYQFNSSLRAIQKVKNYDHILGGIYAGTVDAKKIPQRELTWLLDNKE